MGIKFLPLLALILLVNSFGTVASPQTVEAFETSWLARAIAFQYRLDKNTPLTAVNILGTHNSFNSSAYSTLTSYHDPQQIYSLYDQLRLGARFIELDAHWSTYNNDWFFYWQPELILCHSRTEKKIGNLYIGCSPNDKTVEEGLAEISQWLDENPEAVIILLMEDFTEGHHQELSTVIDRELAGKVYPSLSCKVVPATLTKNKILNSGHQVVLIKNRGCSSFQPLAQLVFKSWGKMSRTLEDRTWISQLAGSKFAQRLLDKKDIARAFQEGTNIVSIDNLTFQDDRMEGAVWSWDENEPDASDEHECSAQQKNGRWRSENCVLSYYHACRNNQNGRWVLSAAPAPWFSGSSACQAQGDYSFGFPVSSRDNEALRNANPERERVPVWLNISGSGELSEWQVGSP